MAITNSNAGNGIHPAVSNEVLEGLATSTELARGLPNEAFTSEEFLTLENQRLFPRAWVFAGPASDIPDRGDVKPVQVAGRSLFMVRSQTDEVRVFQNVCPHRGARLVVEPLKRAQALTCPYHAWSYDLTGQLKGRPHYHGPDKHDKGNNGGNGRVCLFETRSARWLDWVFVNLDGQAPPFEDYLGPVMTRYEAWNLASFRRGAYAAFEFGSNWKLSVENFCDNYHVFKVHHDLHEMQVAGDRFAMDPQGSHMFASYTMASEGLGLTVDPDGPTLPVAPGLPADLLRNSPFCNLFPNSTMAIFPSNVEFFTFEPVSPEQCIMHVWFYFVGDAARSDEHREGREKVVAEWTQLNIEDSGICHRIQQGRSCDAYDGGRLAPYWDTGTVHFHRQVAHAIRGDGPFARV